MTLKFLYLPLVAFVLITSYSCASRAQQPAFKPSLPSTSEKLKQTSLASLPEEEVYIKEDKMPGASEPVIKPKNNMSDFLSKTLETLAFIPNIFDLGRKSGTVNVVFGDTSDGVNANQLVSRKLIEELEIALKNANKVLPAEYQIKEIYISATTNGGHSRNSNHYYKTAVDISRINGVRMISLGRNIQVIELQKALNECELVRENFGPYLKTKTYLNGETKSVYVPAHKDHIHFSIQAEHNVEECLDDCPDSAKYFKK